MEEIKIAGSQKTPYIDLKPNGVFRIGGRSIHEDPDKFFRPVITWIQEYCKTSETIPTRVDIELEYFNSGSAKCVLNILQTLNAKINPAENLTINWYYDEGDYDILERGEYYSSLLSKNFQFIKNDV